LDRSKSVVVDVDGEQMSCPAVPVVNQARRLSKDHQLEAGKEELAGFQPALPCACLQSTWTEESNLEFTTSLCLAVSFLQLRKRVFSVFNLLKAVRFELCRPVRFS